MKILPQLPVTNGHYAFRFLEKALLNWRRALSTFRPYTYENGLAAAKTCPFGSQVLYDALDHLFSLVSRTVLIYGRQIRSAKPHDAPDLRALCCVLRTFRPKNNFTFFVLFHLMPSASIELYYCNCATAKAPMAMPTRDSCSDSHCYCRLCSPCNTVMDRWDRMIFMRRFSSRCCPTYYKSRRRTLQITEK